jgi:hypothetical protein
LFAAIAEKGFSHVLADIINDNVFSLIELDNKKIERIGSDKKGYWRITNN